MRTKPETWCVVTAPQRFPCAFVFAFIFAQTGRENPRNFLANYRAIAFLGLTGVFRGRFKRIGTRKYTRGGEREKMTSFPSLPARLLSA